jgi:predicted DNA-binding protein (MmcQ/YjbR family)
MIDAIQQHCLSKPFVEECLPFGPENLVFKVAGKMFLLVSLDATPLRFNAKNTPEKNEQLREEYSNILPGYHMNKQHWNTVVISNGITWPMVKELINDSYEIVCNSLPKKIKQQLNIGE